MEMIGNGIISVKADVDQVLRFFDGIKVSEKSISRSIMSQVGQGGRKYVRSRYASILHKKSGALYKSIKYRVYENGKNVVFSSDANSGKKTSKDGRIARYGYMLASGYTINAKNGKYLTFNINGKWIKRKSVTVTPRDFMEGPLTRYMESGELKSRIDKAFEKQLEKVEKRLGVRT